MAGYKSVNKNLQNPVVKQNQLDQDLIKSYSVSVTTLDEVIVFEHDNHEKAFEVLDTQLPNAPVKSTTGSEDLFENELQFPVVKEGQILPDSIEDDLDEVLPKAKADGIFLREKASEVPDIRITVDKEDDLDAVLPEAKAGGFFEVQNYEAPRYAAPTSNAVGGLAASIRDDKRGIEDENDNLASIKLRVEGLTGNDKCLPPTKEAGMCADPYVKPLIGRVYKLPVDEKVYRMMDATTDDGKRLVVNAQMWMPNAEEAKFMNDKCIKFCAWRGFTVPKHVKLVHTGMSFTRLVYAQFEDQWVIVDLLSLKVLHQSDNCPSLSEAAPGCKATIEGLADSHGMHVRTLTFRDDVQVHFSRFANPQVLTGIQLTLPQTLDTDNMAGCLVRQTVPEAVQMVELDNLSTLGAAAYQLVDLPRSEPEVFLTFQNKQLINCEKKAL